MPAKCFHAAFRVMLCIVPSVLLLGCRGDHRPLGPRELLRRHGRKPTQRAPSAERPIVADVSRPGHFIFGGEDGTKRIRIEWPDGVLREAVTACTRVAAVCVARPSVKTPHVVFYDAEGRETARVSLPRRGNVHHTARLWVTDRHEAAVWIAGVIPWSLEAEPVDPETYHVSAEGRVTTLGISHVGDFLWRESGFAVVARTADDNWELRRYDSPDALAWKRDLPKRGGVPGFYPEMVEEGIDIVIKHGGFLRFRKDGTEICHAPVLCPDHP